MERMERMRAITVRLPESTYRRMAERETLTGITPSEQVRRAMASWLESEAKRVTVAKPRTQPSSPQPQSSPDIKHTDPLVQLQRQLLAMQSTINSGDSADVGLRNLIILHLAVTATLSEMAFDEHPQGEQR
jgi:hypothetical protein